MTAMLRFFVLSALIGFVVCTHDDSNEMEHGGSGDGPSRDVRARRNGTSNCSASSSVSSCEPPPVIFTAELLQQLAAPSADEELPSLVVIKQYLLSCLTRLSSST